MTATLSAMALMTFISWVTTTIVMPNSALTSARYCRTDDVVRGSTADVGSSQSSTLGPVARARAIATRCFWPPESLAGYVAALSARSTISRVSAARRRRSALPTPANFRDSSTFSWAVRLLSRLKCWKIMPMSCRLVRSSASERVTRSTPSTRTRPDVGRSRRLMLRSSVDFPAPENPMMPWMVPRLMCRLTSSTAVKRPAGRVECRGDVLDLDHRSSPARGRGAAAVCVFMNSSGLARGKP